MLHRIGWFLAGVVTACLIAASLWLGVGQVIHGSEAEGTWQQELFDSRSYNGGALPSNPDRFIDDWLATLPANCDIVPLQDAPVIIAYNCP